jgi:hypothetical protein
MLLCGGRATTTAPYFSIWGYRATGQPDAPPSADRTDIELRQAKDLETEHYAQNDGAVTRPRQRGLWHFWRVPPQRQERYR